MSQLSWYKERLDEAAGQSVFFILLVGSGGYFMWSSRDDLIHIVGLIMLASCVGVPAYIAGHLANVAYHRNDTPQRWREGGSDFGNLLVGIGTAIMLPGMLGAVITVWLGVGWILSFLGADFKGHPHDFGAHH